MTISKVYDESEARKLGYFEDDQEEESHGSCECGGELNKHDFCFNCGESK